MLTSNELRCHITEKDKQTKYERGKFLYKFIPFDTTLPESWVNYCVTRGYPRDTIVSNFVWGYPEGNYMGQPLPLTLQACNIMESLEKG